MTSFNEALCHLMISKGGVALPPPPDQQSSWRWERFGSFYGGSIEASLDDSLLLLQRFANGAKPIYDKCGPSDFGQEGRFNGTFTDTQLTVHYALFPIVLDDDPQNPVEMIAGISLDSLQYSFIKTLESLFTGLTLEEAVIQMEDRITAPEGVSFYYSHHHASGKKTFSPTLF